MADITKYQTNYTSATPEEKAKDIALQEAYLPESIGFILTGSSNSKKLSSNDEPSARPSKEEGDNKVS